MFKRDKNRKKMFDINQALESIGTKNTFKINFNN